MLLVTPTGQEVARAKGVRLVGMTLFDLTEAARATFCQNVWLLHDGGAGMGRRDFPARFEALDTPDAPGAPAASVAGARPWQQAGWRGEVLPWLETALGERVQRLAWISTYDLGGVMSVRTTTGSYFFKTDEDGREARAAVQVAAQLTGKVPEVLAADLERGWLLTWDAGSRLLESGELNHWLSAVRKLAKLHCEVRLTGVPTHRFADLPGQWAALLSPAGLSDWGLDETTQSQILALLPLVMGIHGAVIGLQLPEVACHGDFHANNVLVKDLVLVQGDSVSLYDFSEAGLAHPFTDIGWFLAFALHPGREVAVRHSHSDLGEQIWATYQQALGVQTGLSCRDVALLALFHRAAVYDARYRNWTGTLPGFRPQFAKYALSSPGCSARPPTRARRYPDRHDCAVFHFHFPSTLPSGRLPMRVTVRAAAERRLRGRYPFGHSGDIFSADAGIEPGDVVDVYSEGGPFIGRGYFNPSGATPLRMLTLKRENIDEAFYRAKVRAALKRREGRVTETNAMRVLHGEADGTPGLVADLFGEVLSVQFRNAGVERQRATILKVLKSELGATSAFERSDTGESTREGLSGGVGALWGEVPERVTFFEDDLELHFSPLTGQKTGFFLDQRDNRRLMRTLVQPGSTFLDVYSYTGGFSLHAGRAGARSVAIDKDPVALSVLESVARTNQVEVGVRLGDALEALRRLENEKRRFGAAVIDPPTLAKRRDDVPRAKRVFSEAATSVLKMLEPGGHLLISTCAHYIGVNDLLDAARIAATEAECNAEVLDTTFQPADHPHLLSVPESLYLKSVLLRKEG